MSLALKEDGTVGVLGGNSCQLKEYARQLKDIKSVAAGRFIILGRKQDIQITVPEGKKAAK